MNAPLSPTHLNGLPLAELAKTAEALLEAPENGIVTFSTRTRWLGGTRARTEVHGYEIGGQRIARRHTIDSDEPVEIFGQDGAPNPQELLFAGIGSCVSAIYALKAAKLGVELRALEVEISGTIDMRGPMELAEGVPPGCPELKMRVRVESEASDEELEALHRNVLATSPNYYHLTTAIPARAELVIGR